MTFTVQQSGATGLLYKEILTF
uniref:Uncharacterized protein n=1 Tax=Anguilla anguilla TaxID=7936 RepID=A0A0E9WDG7_ANGAN